VLKIAEERSAAQCSPQRRTWGPKFPTTGEHINPRIASYLNQALGQKRLTYA
jgi:hypothetical protein